MPLSAEDRENAARAFETPEERAERETKDNAPEADADKPRRGRPPGTANKPKLSAEALASGCRSLVKFSWFIAKLPAKIAGGTLTDLTDAELDEGSEEVKGLVLRYGWLVIMLTIVGYPLWMVRTFAAHYRRVPKKLEASNEAETTKLHNVNTPRA